MGVRQKYKKKPTSFITAVQLDLDTEDLLTTSGVASRFARGAIGLSIITAGRTRSRKKRSPRLTNL